MTAWPPLTSDNLPWSRDPARLARALRGALPPVDFAAVAFVRAMVLVQPNGGKHREGESGAVVRQSCADVADLAIAAAPTSK